MLEIAGFISGVTIALLYRYIFSARGPLAFDVTVVAIISIVFTLLVLARSAVFRNDGIHVLRLLATALTGALVIVSAVIGLTYWLYTSGEYGFEKYFSDMARYFVFLTAIQFFAALAFKSIGKLFIPPPLK